MNTGSPARSWTRTAVPGRIVVPIRVSVSTGADAATISMPPPSVGWSTTPDAAAGVVLQPTEGGGMEIVAASAPVDTDTLIGTTIRPGTAVLVQLLAGEPVFIEDSATDARMTTPVRYRF